MLARTHTKRKGWQSVQGGGSITKESIHVSPYEPEKIEIRTGYGHYDATVHMSLDELRIIISTVRSKGIELEPEHERQRELAWELSRSLGVPESVKLAEAAE